jgi:hypothetical protein
MEIKPALVLIILFMLLHPAWARDVEGMRVVSAQEILDKIERGEPVEYDHVIVEGDLDLSELDLPKRHVHRTRYEIEPFGLSESVMLVSSPIGVNDATINGDVSFGNMIFSNPVEFIGSSFNGAAYFVGSEFNISAFSSAEFSKPVYFNDAKFTNSTSFNDSRFKDDALFEGALFDGPLYLTRAKYDRLYIRWKNIRELGYDDAAYLALLENFKKLGYVEDYDASYYEYRRQHRDQDWSGRYHAMNPWEEWLQKRIDFGLQAFYGYGKKPILPLLWSVGTILLFGLIWRKAGVDGGRGRGGIFERFRPKNRKPFLKEKANALFGAMLFSATLFLSGTRLFVDPPALPKLEGWIADIPGASSSQRGCSGPSSPSSSSLPSAGLL